MNITKHFIFLAAFVALLPLQALALSFVEGTIFLEAKSEQDCLAQGGNYMEWGGAIYCTKPPEDDPFAPPPPTPDLNPEPEPETPDEPPVTPKPTYEPAAERPTTTNEAQSVSLRQQLLNLLQRLLVLLSS